jgi:three-Cys-motif partner protein
MLEAMREVGFLINQNRRKEIRLNIDYFFIDNNPLACACLKETLKSKGYGDLIGKSIFIRESLFEDNSNDIISFIHKKSPKRKGRAIFLLDQFNYSDVPTPLINNILNASVNSEIILNFNVDSLLTYISDKNNLAQKLLNGIGIPDALKGRRIEDIKSSEKDWRLCIQCLLHQELTQKCGAEYYTPFFIRSSGGFGDYWLVHLSQHPKARDVMTEIHWEKNNHFIHYGGSGLDMFMTGYIPELDKSYTKQLEFDEFHFDKSAKEISIESLINDIPKLVYKYEDGIKFCDLFSKTCNNSPASAKIYREAIVKLIAEKEIDVIGENQENRQSSIK